MKLTEIIVFSLAVAFFIIGVHQTFTVGLIESYWIFMFTGALLLLYRIKKAPNNHKEEPLPKDMKQPDRRQKKSIKKATIRK